ncbi:hypothetical protein ABXT64_06825 [Candidatus Marifrigoribacter sp. Uisw_064]|jgi:hypothetical protein|uniref:hypothetical protein n=1 Tax=Candidatus Marifrigoribacter sp. Uisw_064 TaxID=3230970 RepID=UPI003AEE5F7E
MKRQNRENKNGCLWAFLVVIFSLLSFGIVATVFNFSGLFTTLISVLLSILLINKMLGKPSAKSAIGKGISIFIILFFFQWFGRFLINNLELYSKEEARFKKEEAVKESTTIETEDTLKVFTSNRKWKDNYGKKYSGDLTVRKSDYDRLKNHINGYPVPSGGNFWGNLYNYIERTDTPSLDLVIENFSEINKNQNLNQMEFADMVVSCIQDIPYSFVFQNKCLPADSYEDSIKQVLVDCPDCCIGNIKYGIQNPVSFVQSLKGDCDTRTVIIYSILKHFNYDVAIVNSNFYRHSILGINIPSRGLYKLHNGKRYVLWETTGKYFEIGQLSKAFNDVTHWNIVLTSK